MKITIKIIQTFLLVNIWPKMLSSSRDVRNVTSVKTVPIWLHNTVQDVLDTWTSKTMFTNTQLSILIYLSMRLFWFIKRNSLIFSFKLCFMWIFYFKHFFIWIFSLKLCFSLIFPLKLCVISIFSFKRCFILIFSFKLCFI